MTDGKEARLQIELCGRLADPCGRVVEITVPDAGLSVTAMLAALEQTHPALRQPLARGRIRACINEVVAPRDAWVAPGDLVALFPPVSGG